MGKSWTLFFDGSCEPYNPGGHACYGWVLYSPDGHCAASGSGHACSGEGATNNVAEWAALEAGVGHLKTLGERVNLLCKGDSKLVVNQVMGLWQCHKDHLREARDRVLTLLEEVALSWGAVWIPREQNSEADALSSSVPGLPPLPQKRVVNWKRMRAIRKRRKR